MPRSTDILLLHPAFRDRVMKLEEQMQSEGIPLRVYEAARTPFRQADLYARGRTIAETKTVTRAKAWESFHQYGLAADFVFFVDSKWTWDEPLSGMWKRYQAAVRELGLGTLEFETPHAQLIYPLSHLRRGVYPDGGASSWSDWLQEEIEAWGPHAREFGGIVHPAAPPAADLHERPALVTT